MRYLPNFPELSLNPEEFDLYSELRSILSVEIVDAQRRIKSQFNTSFAYFLDLRSLVLRQALLLC